MPKTPFKTLVQHTLAAISIKSKAAFEAILKGYEVVLRRDASFHKVTAPSTQVFEMLAYEHFRIELKDKSESLLSGLM